MPLPKLLFTISAIFIFCSCKKDTESNSLRPQPAWTRIADFPVVGRQNAITFSIGSKAFLGLGDVDYRTPSFNDFWQYDPSQNQWSQKTSFPGTIRAAATGFAIGNKGYVVNGLCGCKDFWEYDPANDNWTQKADFPLEDLYYSVAFVIDGKAYVGTGSYVGESASRLSNEFWKYDPTKNNWESISSLPREAVTTAIGFALNGKGYVATGMQMAGYSQELWEYSAEDDTWTKRANFPYPSDLLTSFEYNDKAYVGYGSEIWEYDPAGDIWQKYSAANSAFFTGAASFVVGNSAYVGLGSPAWTVYTPEFWRIDFK